MTALAPAIVMSAYVGITERAADLAIACARDNRDDPDVQYLVGELRNRVLGARPMWRVQVETAEALGFPADIALADRAAQAKTLTAQFCLDAVDKAMEVAGGRAFLRRTGIERLFRDVRAAPYHPLQPKRQHRFTGRLALDLAPG